MCVQINESPTLCVFVIYELETSCVVVMCGLDMFAKKNYRAAIKAESILEMG